MSLPLAFDFALNPIQMLIIGVIAVLLFGKRLPEVGRSLGKHIGEFRKGLRGIEEAIQQASWPTEATDYSPYSAANSTYQQHPEDHEEATAPKFEPPPPPHAASGPSGGNGAAEGPDLQPAEVPPHESPKMLPASPAEQLGSGQTGELVNDFSLTGQTRSHDLAKGNGSARTEQPASQGPGG